MTGFILYGTEGCHLCEEAELILHEAGIQFQHQDIMADTALQEKFGLLIPVLWHSGSGQQLDWPFVCKQVNNFIAKL